MEYAIKRFLLKRLLFIPFGLIAFTATLYAQYNPSWTEQVFSQSIYPVLSSAVGFLPSLVGFSVTEWLVLLFILFCLGYIAFYVRRIILSKGNAQDSNEGSDEISEAAVSADGRGALVYRGIMGLLAIGCVVYFVFTALCGLNYYRYTFTSYTGYTVEQSSSAELEQLCTSLADELGNTRTQLGEDTNLSAQAQDDFEYYAQHSVFAMQKLAQQYPVLDRSFYSVPKPVLASGLLSYSDIGGIFFPFTMESNINADAPFFTLPATMAHELAHQCGFMREDEANFIAYLACRESDELLTQYSGLFLAFNYSISSLSREDPEAAREIIASLPKAVQHDRAQHREFWAQHEGIISEISSDINDFYLKSNSQTDGIQSYGRMVELLLAEQRANA